MGIEYCVHLLDDERQQVVGHYHMVADNGESIEDAINHAMEHAVLDNLDVTRISSVECSVQIDLPVAIRAGFETARRGLHRGVAPIGQDLGVSPQGSQGKPLH